MKPTPPTESRHPSREVKRKPYAKPRLRVLGSVRELTLGGGATTSDGFTLTKL